MNQSLILFIIVFLVGISVCSLMSKNKVEPHITGDTVADAKEGLENQEKVCGSALIKLGGKLLLFIDPNNADEIPIEF